MRPRRQGRLRSARQRLDDHGPGALHRVRRADPCRTSSTDGRPRAAGRVRRHAEGMVLVSFVRADRRETDAFRGALRREERALPHGAQLAGVRPARRDGRRVLRGRRSEGQHRHRLRRRRRLPSTRPRCSPTRTSRRTARSSSRAASSTARPSTRASAKALKDLPDRDTLHAHASSGSSPALARSLARSSTPFPRPSPYVIQAQADDGERRRRRITRTGPDSLGSGAVGVVRRSQEPLRTPPILSTMSEETTTVELDAEGRPSLISWTASTLLQASKLVKALEDKWGVSAAAPAAVDHGRPRGRWRA